MSGMVTRADFYACFFWLVILVVQAYQSIMLQVRSPEAKPRLMGPFSAYISAALTGVLAWAVAETLKKWV